jgi:hypothetical protein
MAIEDRLEELFMNDASNRRVASVNVPQRPNPWRGVAAFAGAAAIAGIALVAVILGLRGGQQAASPTATATATAIPSATSTATTAPSATSSAVPSVSPTTFSGSIYSSPAGYSVSFSGGWRRSDLQSRMTPKDNPDELSIETFTTRTPADEAAQLPRSDTGLGPAQFYTARVAIYRNTRNETAMAYAERMKGLYGLVVVSVEPTTVDGRPAAKTTFKFTSNDAQSFYTLNVQDGDRMWAIGYVLAPSGAQAPELPPGATEPAVRGIVESFKFAR